MRQVSVPCDSESAKDCHSVPGPYFRTDSCSLPSVCTVTRSLESVSRTNHLQKTATNTWFSVWSFWWWSKSAQILKSSFIFFCQSWSCTLSHFVTLKNEYRWGELYRPVWVPMATTAPDGWNPADCAASWHIQTENDTLTHEILCSKRVCITQTKNRYVVHCILCNTNETKLFLLQWKRYFVLNIFR